MLRGTVVHRFGPFELDLASGRLFCGDRRIPLSDTQSAVLVQLVSHAGAVVAKDALIHTAWGATAISDNSIEQVLSRLRKALGDGGRGRRYIETVPHRGYRFAAIVERAERHNGDVLIGEQLAPFRAFVQGRTQLDTLDTEAIRRARVAFEDALRHVPDYAPGHLGLAMACGLTFEATVATIIPDRAALQVGITHARRGCGLAPGSGEAWSTLAFVLYLDGETEEAIASAFKAVELEPDDWRHWLRLAYVSWGGERLRAAGRVLALFPGMALAHWLRATVFIAREAFDNALEELRVGCAAQDAQSTRSGFPAVGLHLLRGLVLAAQGSLDAATEELTRELAWADSGQLYARECAANTWYSVGAVRLRQCRRDEAAAAFERALAIAPRHVSAAAAAHGSCLPERLGSVPSCASGSAMDAATAEAIVLARAGRHTDAARVWRDALAQAPPGSAGWLLPVEPLINPAARRNVWEEALALVRVRAS